MNEVRNLKDGTVTVSIEEFNAEISAAQFEKQHQTHAGTEYQRRLKKHEEALEKKSEGIPMIKIRRDYDPMLGYGRSSKIIWVSEDEAGKKFIATYTEELKKEKEKLQQEILESSKSSIRRAQRGLTIFNAYSRLKGL